MSLQQPPLPLRWPHGDRAVQASYGGAQPSFLLPFRMRAQSQAGHPAWWDMCQKCTSLGPEGRAHEVTEREVAPEDSAGLIVCKVPLSSLPVSCFQKGALPFFLPSLKKAHVCLLWVTGIGRGGVAGGLSCPPFGLCPAGGHTLSGQGGRGWVTAAHLVSEAGVDYGEASERGPGTRARLLSAGGAGRRLSPGTWVLLSDPVPYEPLPVFTGKIPHG